MNTAPCSDKGFTLIEILIALGIFALIASIAALALSQVLITNKHLTVQSKHEHDLEFAISLLRRDTTQILNRSIRDNQQHRVPALIGQAYYLEFTRGGVSNPEAIAQRSSLLRIAYLCQKGKLIRRTWDRLDAPNRYIYHDILIVSGLQSCQFNYITRKRQTLTEWHSVDTTAQEASAESLPMAIICKLNFTEKKSMSVTLPVMVGFYA